MRRVVLVAALSLAVITAGCTTMHPAWSGSNPLGQEMRHAMPEVSVRLADRLTRIGVEELIRQAF